MTKIILGLAGEMASGKGTVADYLVNNYNGSPHGFSTPLRDVAKRLYLEESRDNLQKLSTLFRENFNQEILSKVISGDADKDEHDIVIVDGVRRLPDIEHLKKLPNFKLVYIEASMEKRYKRIVGRGQNIDDKEKTFEEFKKDHEREAELQIKGLKEKADIVIDNEGSFDELYRQVDGIVKENNK